MTDNSKKWLARLHHDSGYDIKDDTIYLERAFAILLEAVAETKRNEWDKFAELCRKIGNEAFGAGMDEVTKINGSKENGVEIAARLYNAARAPPKSAVDPRIEVFADWKNED